MIIATPPHWHALMAIDAVKAGKDIYLQKPMTLYPDETLAVRNAVNRHKRISQIGTQIHASAELPARGRVDPLGQAGAGQRRADVQRDEPGPRRHRPRAAAGPAGGPRLGPVARARARRGRSTRCCSPTATTTARSGTTRGGWTPGMAPHIIDLPIWALDLGVPLDDQLLRRALRDQGRRRRARHAGSALAVSAT